MKKDRFLIGLPLFIVEMIVTIIVASSCDTVAGAINAFCYCLCISLICSGIVDCCLRDKHNDW